MTKTILVLAANPKDTTRLRLDQEVREIDSGLQRARRRDEFILKQVWAARPKDVRRAMLDYRPSIVHFCGHGEGEHGIALEDETGSARLVSTEALEGLFELFADTVQCVVLNACYSETQAEVLSRHIQHVVGMKGGIADRLAIEFAVAFYDALGAGKSVEFAYSLGRNAIIQVLPLPEEKLPALKSKKAHITQTSSPSFRYYIYVSDTKVNMLFSQIPQGLRTWPSTHPESSSDDIPYSDTKYSRVEAVTDYLVKHIGVSDVDDDDIGPYFKGVLAMRWGPFADKLAFFGGTSRQRTVGLGGSIFHVIGNIDRPLIQAASSNTPSIIDALWKDIAPELGMEYHSKPGGPFGFGDTETTLRGVRGAVGSLKGAEEELEFVAKTLLQGETDYGHTLLGTPIYVALAD